LVNATLYFLNNPGENLGSIPASQKLEFNEKTIRLEPLERIRDNNIKQTPNPNPDGVRKMITTENGLLVFTLPLKINIRQDQQAEIDKLEGFIDRPQVTDLMQFGIIGIDYPNADIPFSLIPSDSKGYSIGPTITRHMATDNSVDYQITLLFGGII